MSLGEILLAIAAAGGLGVILLAVLARLNGEDQDDGEPTTRKEALAQYNQIPSTNGKAREEYRNKYQELLGLK